MKRPTKITVVTICLGIIFVASILTVSRRSSEEAPPDHFIPQVDNISIRLKWLPHAGYLVPFVAQDEGFFQQNNIQSTINSGGPGLDSTILVASGSDDFGITGADQLLIARSKGVPIVAIAVEMQDSPVCFFAKTDTGIRSPRDFVGKRVGVKPGTNVDTEYRAILKKLMIDSSKIEETPIKFDMSPFFEGNVDVWSGYMFNEYMAALAKGLDINLIQAKTYGINTYGSVWITHEKTIRERPDLVQHFVDAILKSWTWALENPDEAVNILVKNNPKLKFKKERKAFDIVRDLVLAGQATTKGIGWMSKEGWQMNQEVFVDLGIVPKPQDLDAAFDNQFVRNYYERH